MKPTHLSKNRSFVLVPQAGSLLFRRLAVGGLWQRQNGGLPIRDTADCPSAPRSGALRLLTSAATLSALLLVGAGELFAEETNAPTVTATNITETHITSKTVDFDLKTRQAIYHGNVRVEDPRVNLSCEVLIANIPEGGGRVDSIVAETNVVILLPDKGATNRATADRAVYTYSISGGVTNEVLELQGSPAIETAQGTLKGDSIIWDRANDTIKATNQRMVVRQEEKDGDTNAIPELRSLKP